MCTNTVEERILIRAQQKHVIQNTVYAGGFKMAANDNSERMDLQELFSTTEELTNMLESDPTKQPTTTATGAPATTATTAAASAVAATPAATAAPAAAAAASNSIGSKHQLDDDSKEQSTIKRQRSAL